MKAPNSTACGVCSAASPLLFSPFPIACPAPFYIGPGKAWIKPQFCQTIATARRTSPLECDLLLSSAQDKLQPVPEVVPLFLRYQFSAGAPAPSQAGVPARDRCEETAEASRATAPWTDWLHGRQQVQASDAHTCTHRASSQGTYAHPSRPTHT